jgi:hypothetical protein
VPIRGEIKKKHGKDKNNKYEKKNEKEVFFFCFFGMVHVDYTAVLYPSLPSVSVLAIEYNQL